jgi:hypothetical protein
VRAAWLMTSSRTSGEPIVSKENISLAPCYHMKDLPATLGHENTTDKLSTTEVNGSELRRALPPRLLLLPPPQAFVDLDALSPRRLAEGLVVTQNPRHPLGHRRLARCHEVKKWALREPDGGDAYHDRAVRAVSTEGPLEGMSDARSEPVDWLRATRLTAGQEPVHSNPARAVAFPRDVLRRVVLKLKRLDIGWKGWVGRQEGTEGVREEGGHFVRIQYWSEGIIQNEHNDTGEWSELASKVEQETYGVTMRWFPARNGSRMQRSGAFSRSGGSPIYICHKHSSCMRSAKVYLFESFPSSCLLQRPVVGLVLATGKRCVSCVTPQGRSSTDKVLSTTP